MKNKLDCYWYRVALGDRMNYYDIDWMDIEDFKTLDAFQKEYNLDVPLIFIAAACVEFMAEFMDCLSCSLQVRFFEDFYNFLIAAENKAAPN